MDNSLAPMDQKEGIISNIALPPLTSQSNSNVPPFAHHGYEPYISSNYNETHSRSSFSLIEKLTSSIGKEEAPPPILANSNNERSMFQQAPSSRPGVSLFLDADLSEKVAPGARITKDIIVWFYWEKAFQKPNEFEDCDVYIDNSIYYSGNSKKKRRPKEPTSLVLSAIVTDNNQTEMQVCNTCSNPSNKSKGMIILIRNAIRIGTDLKIMGSLTCSGNPSSATRLLQVHFGLSKGHNQLSSGSSIFFCVYHHRRKRNAEDSDRQSVVKQHKLLKPKVACSLDDVTSTQVKELTPHLLEVILADTSGRFFSESLLHLTLRDLDIFVQNYQVYDTSCLVTLAEFFLNANGIGHKAYDPFTQFDGDTGRQMKTLQGYLRNMAVISKQFSQKANERDSSSWQRIQKSFWEFVYEPQNGRKFCTCHHCMNTHLNFVLKFVRNQGSLPPDLLDNLHELNISSKSGKSWQSIVYGKIDDEQNFNWTLYLQPSPLGKFSRKWYPANHMKVSGMNALITTTTPFYAARHWEDAKVVFAVRSLDVEQQMLQKNLQFFDQIIGYLKIIGDQRDPEPSNMVRDLPSRILPTPNVSHLNDDNNNSIISQFTQTSHTPIQLPAPVRAPEYNRSVPLSIHDFVLYPQMTPTLFPLPSNVPDSTLSQLCQQIGMLSPYDLEQLLSNPAWQSAVSNALRSFKSN